MSTEPSAPPEREEQLSAVLVACLEALDAGRPLDRDDLLARYPQFAGELARFLDDQADVERCAAPLRALTRGEGPAADPPWPRLGDFRIVREVGRGGMGIVYEAEQVSLKRRVALKVLPFAATLDPKQLARFRMEAQAAAGLHHTNIVPIYAVGSERGTAYYAMQFIDGQTLAAVVRQLRRPARPQPTPAGKGEIAEQPTTAYAPPPGATVPEGGPSTAGVAALSTDGGRPGREYYRAVARLGVQAAEALDYAHQLGVVHRDVKPANLLVDGQGRLWVTDFGLARVQSEASLTATGDLVGTLRYMSPEQALAKRVPIDHRTDVYSLGATLYELLTLRPPFPGTDRQELLRQIAFEEPVPPRRLNKAIPTELETIVLKALEKCPGERYATAQELGQDLRRFLEDRTIRARRPTLPQRLRKWSGRHRSFMTVVLITAALGVLGLSAGGLYHTAKLTEALGATAAREREAVTNLYHARVEEADALRRARGVGYRSRVWDRLRSALSLQTPDRNLNELRQTAVMCLGDFVGLEPVTWAGLDAAIGDLALGPDGSQAALALYDGTLRVRDVRTGKESDRLDHAGAPVLAACFTPDGERLISADNQGGIKMWGRGQAGRWTCVRTWATGQPAPAPQVALAVTPDGKQVLGLSGAQGGVWACNLGDYASPARIAGTHDRRLSTIGLSPDGKFLAGLQDEPPTLFVWDLPARQLQRSVPLPILGYNLAFSPDGRFLAIGLDSGLLLLETPYFRQWSLTRLDSVTAVRFSPDSQFVAFTTGTSDIKLWSVSTNREVAVLKHPDSCVKSALAFSRDGDLLVSGGGRAVRLWRLDGAAERRHLAGHEGGVPGVAFRPDGTLLASCGKDRAVKIWDPATGQLVHTLPLLRGAAQVAAFSPDGRFLATGDYAGELRVWDVGSWQEVQEPINPGLGAVRGLAFSPDGEFLAACGSAGLRIWRTGPANSTPGTRPRLRLQPDIHLPGIECCYLRISPDSKLVAWSDYGKQLVCLWDVPERREVLLPAPPLLNGYHCLAFGPDSRHLAFVTRQRVAEVWDVAVRRRVLSLGDRGDINSWYVALSNDGQWLATAPSPSAVTLWDAQTGDRLFSLPEERSPIWCFDWSQAGDRLAVGLSDGGLVIWDLPAIRRELAQLGFAWPSPSGKSLDQKVERRGTPAGPEKESAVRAAADATALEDLALRYMSNGGDLEQVRPGMAERGFREALRLKPEYPEAHFGLGNALLGKGRLQEAIDEYRAALRARKGYPEAHNNLAYALHRGGRLDESIAECREALRLRKDFPEAHSNLGNALRDRGRLKEAFAEYREALRLKADLPQAHYNFGLALCLQGEVGAALAEFRKAVPPKKEDPEAHYNLANTLWDKGQLDEAIAEFREAIRLKDEYAEAHCNLGLVLVQKGRFRMAGDELRLGHDLGSRRPGWSYPSAEWLRNAERLADLDDRLPKLLAGQDRPAHAEECLALAQLCQLHKQLFAASARWYGEAFAARPALAENLGAPGSRYDAACAAALAGCGRGQDAGRLDDQEKARLRQQAVDWLRADLDAWRRLLERDPDKAGRMAAQQLQHGLEDPDFSGVRGPEALGRLPEAERRDWQKLWQEVEALRQRAAGLPTKRDATRP